MHKMLSSDKYQLNNQAFFLGGGGGLYGKERVKHT